jgi:dTDP-4-amino-4,6-dideoxygalactose transaminase
MVRLKSNSPMSREKIMNSLLEWGVATRRGIMASHREAAYRDPQWEQSLVETNAATEQCLILPLYHQMTLEDQDYVVECIERIAAGS